MANELNNRLEYGYPRTECGCHVCTTNCRYMPGFLNLADLGRLLPETGKVEWASQNLLASPGALAMKDGVKFRIPTLVSSVKADGTCVHLTDDNRCSIHAAAPFGCAFFDCGPERGNPRLSHIALAELMHEFVRFQANENSDYYTLWSYLWQIGKRQRSAEELRAKMVQITGQF